MKIVVVGTSNSVMGNKGYIEALRLEHEVVQLSTGRTPFYSCMKIIVSNKDEVESSDLLIIDHYINDVNFYGDFLGDLYREHLELFYDYLSSLNVNILNLMFPIQDIEDRKSIDIYYKTKSLCERYCISILDLNEFNVPKSFYKDSIHLTHDVSYALGLSLNNGLLKNTLESVKSGDVSYFPFYSLDFCSFSDQRNDTGNFKNSLINIDYLKLEFGIKVSVPEEHKLIALGVFRDNSIDGCSGFLLNNQENGITGRGYFLETVGQNVYGDFTISPLNGQNEVKNMMGRGMSKGIFTYCYIVDALLFDSGRGIEFRSASRKSYQIDVSCFITLANKIISRNDEPTLPKISPKSVDELRDLALSFEKKDLQISRDIMLLAHIARPKGPLIERKLAEYEQSLSQVKSGEIKS